MKPPFPDAFKKIEIGGQDFELIPATATMAQENWEQGWKKNNQYYLLKPVKKTEKGYYFLQFGNENVLIDKNLLLTPTTAHKLSEAISALVEAVTKKEMSPTDSIKTKPGLKGNLIRKVEEAAKSFQESQ